MGEHLQDPLEKYFKAVKMEPLAVSFEETKLHFEVNVVAEQQPLWRSFKQFFSNRLNILYSIIAVVLIVILTRVDLEMSNNLTYREREVNSFEQHKQIDHQNATPIIDQQQEDEEAINPVQIVEKQTIVANETLQEEEKAPVLEEITTDPGKETSQEKVSESEITAANKTKKEIESEELSKVTSPPAGPKQKVKNEKPPFRYTFTPVTPEAELRKLQADLKRENIILTFSKLNYKNGIIKKVEGTIEMPGYLGTFTTDEFVDFTFRWNYSKYKAYGPDKFDIIINTPMERKSNTAIHIDEIED